MSTKTTDYEKKLIEMRYQMQENQVSMDDCFKDLESWTQDIKVKEKKILEDPNYLKNTNKGLPPIRALATPKKKKKVKKPTETSEKETKSVKKINSYDYSAWDKLDVDKMCEEVDEKEKSSSSDYTTDEEYEEEQRKVRANWEKERGNQFFKDNMLNDAINCYTKAIELDPLNCIYPANRAMCLIKQEKYGAAENDCSLSIAIDSTYVKAYHRRATCRTHLKKYEEAKKDIEMILKIEPNNKIAQQELFKLEQLAEDRHLVFPIFKKEVEKSKKPLKRIEIQEINDESSEQIELEKNLSQRTQLNTKEQTLFDLKPTKEENKNSKIVEVTEIENVKQVEKPSEKLAEKLAEKVVAPQKESKILADSTVIKSPKKAVPNAPSNGYQFRKDWQFLSDNLEDLATYFKKIHPNQYEKLFLNGLESDNLSKILSIFKNNFINDSNIDLYSNMNYLSKTKRFQTQLMFLSDSDKKTICELIEHLKSSSKYEPKDIQILSDSYKF